MDLPNCHSCLHYFSSLSHVGVQVSWPGASSTISAVSAYKLNTQNAASKAQGPWRRGWACAVVRAGSEGRRGQAAPTPPCGLNLDPAALCPSRLGMNKRGRHCNRGNYSLPFSPFLSDTVEDPSLHVSRGCGPWLPCRYADWLGGRRILHQQPLLRGRGGSLEQVGKHAHNNDCQRVPGAPDQTQVIWGPQTTDLEHSDLETSRSSLEPAGQSGCPLPVT